MSRRRFSVEQIINKFAGGTVDEPKTILDVQVPFLVIEDRLTIHLETFERLDMDRIMAAQVPSATG